MSSPSSASEGASGRREIDEDAANRVCRGNLSLSRWVNEKFPPWTELLSAHDVARLVRRPRWMIPGLVFLRRLPKQRRYHGQPVGWMRSELTAWLAHDRRVTTRRKHKATPALAAQRELPLRRCPFRRRGTRGQRCRRTVRRWDVD